MSVESISNSINNALNTPWQQNTVIWIIIAGVVGGVITEVFKFVFEHSLPERQRKKATRIAIQKYRQPIAQAATKVCVTIGRIIRNPSILNDNNERLGILYNFGSLLGWIQIFLNESFYEGIQTPERLNYQRMAKYQYYLSDWLNGISFGYDYQLDVRAYPEITRSVILPRHALSAIGELMIDKSEKGDGLIQTVINISDFSRNYQSDEFKKWFTYLENILFNQYRSKSSPQWNMLIMINAYTVLFCFRSFIKTSIFPADLISYPFKSPLSIILWLPYKIDKWLSITNSFIIAYKTDKSIVRSLIESITAGHKERKQRHKSLRVSGLDSIIVEKGSDHLKYTTVGITLSWSLTSGLFAKSGTRRTIIQYLMPFLNYRFLDDNALGYIRSRLEFAGFISAIDKEYQDEISYLKALQRKDNEIIIRNELGLIYTYLVHKEEHQFKAKTYIEKAVECFDRCLILDKYKGNRLPLVNKGFVYMEFEHDYHKAIECFEEAVDDYSQPGSYHLHPYGNVDLWNVIGVLYYELGDYGKAIECFEEAIKIDHQHELAIHNRSIAITRNQSKKNL